MAKRTDFIWQHEALKEVHNDTQAINIKGGDIVSSMTRRWQVIKAGIETGNKTKQANSSSTPFNTLS